jgi:hypothetical protein
LAIAVGKLLSERLSIRSIKQDQQSQIFNLEPGPSMGLRASFYHSDGSPIIQGCQKYINECGKNIFSLGNVFYAAGAPLFSREDPALLWRPWECPSGAIFFA